MTVIRNTVVREGNAREEPSVVWMATGGRGRPPGIPGVTDLAGAVCGPGLPLPEEFG